MYTQLDQKVSKETFLLSNTRPSVSSAVRILEFEFSIRKSETYM